MIEELLGCLLHFVLLEDSLGKLVDNVCFPYFLGISTKNNLWFEILVVCERVALILFLLQIDVFSLSYTDHEVSHLG